MSTAYPACPLVTPFFLVLTGFSVMAGFMQSYGRVLLVSVKSRGTSFKPNSAETWQSGLLAPYTIFNAMVKCEFMDSSQSK